MPVTSGPPEPRKGVWLFPNAPAAQLVDSVIAAEEAGLDEVWIADEGVARDPMAVLAAAATATSRVRLAVGITSPLLRHPGAIAVTAATVDELSDGRFVLGLGVGGAAALAPFGLSTARPVGVLGDAIRTARAVLAAEPGVGFTPAAHGIGSRPVPIWVGARGAQLVRLAARIADGVFLSGCTAGQHEEIVGAVREISTGAGVAIYQSASDAGSSPTASRWDEVGGFLAAENARWHPTSIGINLVDLAEGGRDPVALVRRAADVLEAGRADGQPNVSLSSREAG